MHYAYWVGGRIRQNTSSLWGRRGDSLYCSINSYSGGGKDDKGLVSPFLHSKTLLGYLLFHSWVITFFFLFLGPILWPLLIPCSCLAVYLFPFSAIWEPSLREKGAMTTLASSGCTGVSWGSGFPLPALCQGTFTEGDESP